MTLRPYLAIIKDAFRAAIASNVLYVLLGLITLLLLVLAPLHYRETLDWELSGIFLADSSAAIAEELHQKKDRDDQPIVKRIWERLPSELQTSITTSQANKVPSNEPTEGAAAQSSANTNESAGQADDETADDDNSNPSDSPRGPGNRFRLSEKLAVALNDLMKQRDFYDAEVWKTVVVSTEAQDLLNEGVGQLSEVRLNRLNRLLINNAVRSMPQPRSAAVKIYYGPFHASFIPADISRSQLTQTLKQTIQFVFDKFVLSVGILIAIIVTSSMIPETFEPGSLNLLLSKPIHRTGLLVSKFLGGTAFIAVCAAYLFLGTWLWMGIALGTWDDAALWSIPLYVLVFAIYFSVSVLAGVIYKSAIVSVVLTGVFWAFCYAIGSAYGFINASVQNDQITWAGQLGDQTVAVNKFSQLMIWNESQKSWDFQTQISTMREEDQIGLAIARFMAELPAAPTVRPIEDTSSNTMLFLSFNAMPPGSFSNPVLNVTDTQTQKVTRLNATEAISVLRTPQGPVLVTADGRFQRLDCQQLVTTPSDPTSVPDPAAPINSAAAQIPEGARTPLGPDRRKSLTTPNRIAADPRSGQIVMFSGGTLTLFELQGETYVALRQVKIDSGSERDRMSASVTLAYPYALVAFGNAKVVLVDVETMQMVNAYRPETQDPPIAICGKPDGSAFYTLFRNGRVWTVDTAQPDSMKLAPLSYQGSISGIDIDAQGHMSLCHSIDRVVINDTSDGKTIASYYAAGDFLKNAYRYVVKPLYLVCPKPSEFYKLVAYLSTARSADVNYDIDMRDTDVNRDPWSPLWSGIGFMLVTLSLAALYFSRSDC